MSHFFVDNIQRENTKAVEFLLPRPGAHRVKSAAVIDRLFFATQKPLPQSLTNETDFSKVIPTIETFFREEDPPRRLIKMKW